MVRRLFSFLDGHNTSRYENLTLLARSSGDAWVATCKGVCFLAGALALLRFALS